MMHIFTVFMTLLSVPVLMFAGILAWASLQDWHTWEDSAIGVAGLCFSGATVVSVIGIWFYYLGGVA